MSVRPQRRTGVADQRPQAKTASVVIVTYNSAAFIGPCLESLQAFEPWVTVVVVDNASSDGTVELVRSHFPSVSIVSQDSNRGFSGGVNAGVAATDSDYVFLLNPDTYLAQQVLEELTSFMEGDLTSGATGPKILNDDGALQASCRRYPTMWSSIFNRTSLLTRLSPRNRMSGDYLMTDFDHASIRDVDWLSGAALMLRRSAFEKVGGMDEGYFLYFEDVDLCHRLHEAGYRVVYNPKVSVVHHISRSSGRLSRQTIIARHRGMWRYWRRYQGGNPLKDAVARVAIWGRCALQLVGNTIGRN